MGAPPLRAHPPIRRRGDASLEPPRAAGLDLGARRQPRGEALAVQRGRRLQRQSGLNIRAGLWLRMRTKLWGYGLRCGPFFLKS